MDNLPGENPFQSSLPPGYGVPEPKTPVEAEQRVSGWAALQKKLEDPNIQQAMLRAGIAMMQPVPLGASTAGHIASGVGMGVDYLNQRRQLELENQQRQQQIDAQTQLQGAQTQESQARTTQTIPAAAAESRSQTKRREALLPVELDAKAKELALLDWELKNAPTTAEQKRVQLKKDSLQLELDEQYGGQDRASLVGLRNAQTSYYNALSAAQSGLEAERKAKAAKADKTKWKLSTVKQDEEDPYNFIVTHYSDDGDARIATIHQPLPAVEAAARAKQDIKVLTDEQIASRYPGMTRQKAQAMLASEYMKRRMDVTHIAGPGGATAEPPTEKKKTELHDTPSRTDRPVPQALVTYPDGTLIPDKAGNWWIKQGNVLRPALPEEVQAAQKQATPAPAPSVPPAPGRAGDMSNLPGGVVAMPGAR